jgi:POT family proton-dependent oligopeptide transporter
MTSAPDDKPRMPRQIRYIIANEGCERFSFYGMRNILTPFLMTYLLVAIPEEGDERKIASKAVFHTFVMGVYFFPLLGGWIADRLFGKYNTILWFSLIYCLGHGCLALFEDSRNGFYIGLFLIALGSGGIKPLVASFMGDQFDGRTKHLAKIVFDAFYWIINFGSFFASLLMPAFLMTFGPAVAFGIPGALMFIATVAFWAGRKSYVMMPVAPRNPNSFMRVVRTALVTPSPTNGSRPGLFVAILGCVLAAASFGLLYWIELVPVICLAFVILLAIGGIGTAIQLEHARGKHSDEAVNGVRAVLSILIVFALVTPFHSLFDQKATEWVHQGGLMDVPAWEIDLAFLGIWETNFSPAQMQAFNPLLVMILIPFNNLVLYPWMKRLGWEPTSLRRMTFGIMFSGLAWVVIAFIQIKIEASPDKITILWQILPYAVLTLGEVLVSATGLEFAYSQAPLVMKGVIMSFWNLTTTVGQLWVILGDHTIRSKSVTGLLEDQGISQTVFFMFFFAGFAFLAAIAFKLYTRRYRMLDNYRPGPGAGPPGDLPKAVARDR